MLAALRDRPRLPCACADADVAGLRRSRFPGIHGPAHHIALHNQIGAVGSINGIGSAKLSAPVDQVIRDA